MNTYSDHFFQSLTSGNQSSFGKLYEDTIDKFYRYLKGNYQLSEEVIQDILSETYIKIWNSLSKIRSLDTLSSYIRTIMKNTLKDHFKKQKETSFSELDSNGDDEYDSFESGIEDEEDIRVLMQTKFQSESIIQALESLDDIYKDVLFLKYIEGYSNGEIASELNAQEDNIRQRLSRGLAKLRVVLLPQ